MEKTYGGGKGDGGKAPGGKGDHYGGGKPHGKNSYAGGNSSPGGKSNQDGGKQGKGGTSSSSSSWQNPQSVQFAGYCGTCGKWGHKSADCRSGGGGRPQVSGVDSSGKQQASASPKVDKDGKTIEAMYLAQEEESQFILGVLNDDVSAAGARDDSSTKHRVLVDSGSAVTAIPWEFGSGYDVERNRLIPLRSVTGATIDHYGERRVPCIHKSGRMITIEGEVTNVRHPVAGVSSMNERGASAWFPAVDLPPMWLVDDNNNWTRLDGPCLISGAASSASRTLEV